MVLVVVKKTMKFGRTQWEKSLWRTNCRRITSCTVMKQRDHLRTITKLHGISSNILKLSDSYSTFIGSLVLTYCSWREQYSEWICFWFTSQKAWLATRMIVVLECRYPLEKIPLISWNRYNSYNILKMINLLLERRIYQSYNRG